MTKASEDMDEFMYDSDDRLVSDEEDDDDSRSGEPEGDFEPRAGGLSTSRGGYEVIKMDSLLSAQAGELAQVQSVLGVTLTQARTLLIHYRWNQEALFGEFAEHDLEAIFSRAGVTGRTAPSSSSSLSSAEAAASSSEPTCLTCFTEVPAAEMTSMSCGHSFCSDCWRQHIRIKVTDGQARRLRCMGFKCGAVCDEDVVMHLLTTATSTPAPPEPEAGGACSSGVASLSDGEVAVRYKRVLLESYIEDNQRVKWCPSVPHCGNAIKVKSDEILEPECDCGARFCFGCGEVPHSPCTCAMWRAWGQKCQDETETSHWLNANTKPCPKCEKPVEKNGGCNLVCCPCGQCFCWLCGAATGREHTWTNIANHSCGRYKEEKDREIEKAQRLLNRYLHYHARWKGHSDSCKLEEQQLEDVQRKVALLEASSEATSLRDFSWLITGLHQLFRARRALSFSYVFAYFMFGNDMFKDEVSEEDNALRQQLFEDGQAELEECIERLSHEIELSPEKMAEASRLEVVNLTSLVDQRTGNLFDVVEVDLLGTLPYTSHSIAQYKPGHARRRRPSSSAFELATAAARQAPLPPLLEPAPPATAAGQKRPRNAP